MLQTDPNLITPPDKSFKRTIKILNYSDIDSDGDDPSFFIKLVIFFKDNFSNISAYLSFSAIVNLDLELARVPDFRSSSLFLEIVPFDEKLMLKKFSSRLISMKESVYKLPFFLPFT